MGAGSERRWSAHVAALSHNQRAPSFHEASLPFFQAGQDQENSCSPCVRVPSQAGRRASLPPHHAPRPEPPGRENAAGASPAPDRGGGEGRGVWHECACVCVATGDLLPGRLTRAQGLSRAEKAEMKREKGERGRGGPLLRSRTLSPHSARPIRSALRPPPPPLRPATPPAHPSPPRVRASGFTAPPQARSPADVPVPACVPTRRDTLKARSPPRPSAAARGVSGTAAAPAPSSPRRPPSLARRGGPGDLCPPVGGTCAGVLTTGRRLRALE